MCVVSNVADNWMQRWPHKWPELPIEQFPWPATPTREEFEELKQEVESLKKLLKAAKIYDEETGQPNCEKEEKIAFIKELAKILNVDMEDILG